MILSSIRTQTYYSIWHWPFGTNKKSKCVQDAGHKSPESRPGPEHVVCLEVVPIGMKTLEAQEAPVLKRQASGLAKSYAKLLRGCI